MNIKGNRKKNGPRLFKKKKVNWHLEKTFLSQGPFSHFCYPTRFTRDVKSVKKPKQLAVMGCFRRLACFVCAAYGLRQHSSAFWETFNKMSIHPRTERITSAAYQPPAPALIESRLTPAHGGQNIAILRLIVAIFLFLLLAELFPGPANWVYQVLSNGMEPTWQVSNYCMECCVIGDSFFFGATNIKLNFVLFLIC